MSTRDCCLNRAAFLIYVNLDPIPENFHTPLSAMENISSIFNNFGLSNREPNLIMGSMVGNSERKGVYFVAFIDLDPVQGTFHSKNSARAILEWILNTAIPHYDPIVTIAPDEIQPEKILSVK